MQVGILGAGSAAYGAAAWLCQSGHDPMIWSPSGKRTALLAAGEPLLASGAIEGSFAPRIAADCAQAVGAGEVVLLALPGFAHKAVLDAAAPLLRAGQTVIIGSHLSFGALYLAALLAARGLRLPIIAWGTTLTLARQISPTQVHVVAVREQIDLATVPIGAADQAQALCNRLFGARFVQRDGLLAIALSNLNPQNHLAISLLNLTRMEHGEDWEQAHNITPAVARLIEALDLERLAIARAFGVAVRSVHEHFALSFHVAQASVYQMNQERRRAGRDGPGPKTALSRHVLEDVPFGLLATVQLARTAGVSVPLHEAGIALFSAAYGRDFAQENDLLRALDIAELSAGQLRQFAHTGIAPG